MEARITTDCLTSMCRVFYFVALILIFIVSASADKYTINECDIVTQNLTCHWQNLCPNEQEKCHCDDLCEMLGDCCPEFKPNITANNQRPLQMSCKYAPLISDSSSIFIIDSCPNEFDDDATRHKCEYGSVSQGLLAVLPVSGRHGHLFQNIFCAQCNDFPTEEVLFWRAKVVCLGGTPNITEVQMLIERNQCYMNFEKPSELISTRECFDVNDVIDHCLTGYPNDCTKFYCEASDFVRHVYGFYEIYKNEHCAKCNLLPQNDLFVHFSCQPFDTRARSDIVSDYYHPISLIIDLNTAGGGKVGYKEYGQTVNETEFQTCDSGYLLDILEDECVLVYCSAGFIPIGKKCVSKSENISDCTRRIIQQEDYKLLENKTIVEKSGQVFNSSQYEHFGNGTIGVCINFDIPKLVLKFDKAQTIFSVVGQCISIICLIIHLTVYSILPQLRNPPGKSLMALVASLLAAQLLFLFGVGQTEPYGLCVTIGVLIHYSFLASFFWMGLMSFDIWATFSESNVDSTFHNRSNRFRKYCIIGFLGPSLIVSISLILNCIDNVPTHIKPGYGDGLCWIVHRMSLIIFFGIPIFTIVIINISLYCLTLRALYNITQATKVVHRDASEHQRFWLYVKLSVIMGLTWVFGLIAVFADVYALWYIFLFFNTLQGAIICVSFIFTKKVINLLKDRFKRGLPFHSENTGSDGTRSTDLSKRSSKPLASTASVPLKTL